MKTDARKHSEEVLQALRVQAHRLRHEQGRTWDEIASIVGVHRSTIMSWVRRFHLGSPTLEHTSSARRGRVLGSGRTLEPVEEVRLREIVREGPPSAVSLPFALWSRRAVQAAVKSRFGVDMPLRTVTEYLRRWGFTPQRPVKRAIEQRPAEVQRWLDEEYPAIERRAKAERGEIYWGDETAVRQDTAWVRGFAPAGHTPELRHRARWDSITLISAISHRGQVHFALHDGAINTARFIDFLAALVSDARPKKVFLIVDNLRVHKAGEVQAWLESRKRQIELFYLPPYTPEANPDEMLNRDLKTTLRSQAPARDRFELRGLARSFMARLQSAPERIKRYFQHASVRYAA